MSINRLTDRRGSPLAKGNFIKLLRPIDGVVPGPYRFQGCRKGIPYFSVAGIDFPLRNIDSEVIEKLDWKDWKRTDYYLDRFLKFYYKSKTPESATA